MAEPGEALESILIKRMMLRLAVAMLCTSGLAACAQPAPGMHDPQGISDSSADEAERAGRTADAAAIASTPVPRSGSDGTNRETLPVTTETRQGKASGPPIAPALLQQRILRFVDGIHSPSDITRPRLEAVMDARLQQNPGFGEAWWFTGATDEHWTYTLKVSEQREEDQLPLIDISFSAGDVEGNARATVCTYALEAFAGSLVDLGFTRHPGWQQPGAQLLFTRQAANGRFGTTVRLRKYTQQTGREENDFRYCVYVIHVSAGNSPDGE